MARDQEENEALWQILVVGWGVLGAVARDARPLEALRRGTLILGFKESVAAQLEEKIGGTTAPGLHQEFFFKVFCRQN